MNRVGAPILALALIGCAGPRFEVSDLPAAPIAVLYRNVEETDRVQDMMEQQRKPTDRAARSGRLEVEMERIQALAGWRSSAEMLRDQAGRLALFVAPEGRLDVADFARRGARPVDWSPDGTRLLFAAASGSADGLGVDGVAGRRQQLFEWDAERREVRQVTRGRWSYGNGCYGPDGAIAFVEVARPKGQPPSSRIWIRRRGEAAHPLTDGPADGAPTWSPRGDRIVYVSIERGNQELLRWADPESGEGGVLTRGRAPTFTPDGAWLVYSAKTRGWWKLWRMRADGGSRRRFGDSAFHESYPSVSPDGRFVVYSGTKQEVSASSRLFVRPLDGSPDRQLEISGSAWMPVW